MNTPVRCIGITGMNGAGKTKIAGFLSTHYPVGFYEVREFLDAESVRRHMPKGRESLREVANILRRDHGPDYVVRSIAENAIRTGTEDVFVIESIRCVGEVDYLMNTFGKAFVLIGTNAMIKTRYDRVQKRGSQTDNVSFELFCQHEALEKDQIDPWKQNLNACMDEVTDGFLVWNQGSEELLCRQVRALASEMGLKELPR